MPTAKNFGGVDLSAATPIDVFQGPTNGATFSLTVVNRGVVTAKVKIGFSSTSNTFEPANYIEFETSIPAKGVIERSGLVIEDATKYLVIESDVASVNVVAYGITL